ncbi:hypothetical protein D021_1743B, partial [Vibrio parahaemolyticus 10296]
HELPAHHGSSYGRETNDDQLSASTGYL